MAQLDDPGRPPPDHWDQAFAERLIGRTVLVGLTHETRDGEFLRHEQLYGFVVKVDRRTGIHLELDGSRVGEAYVLPPQTSRLQPAKRGEYRLKTTGEVVVDPDYLSTWIVNPRVDA